MSEAMSDSDRFPLGRDAHRRAMMRRIKNLGIGGWARNAKGMQKALPSRETMTMFLVTSKCVDLMTPKHHRRRQGPSEAELDEMIEEAIVDAYGESEQTIGFYTLLEEHLKLPFMTEVLGMEVKVDRLDMTDDEQIVAVCSHGKLRQRIPILDLPLPTPPPQGAAWINAFCRWACGRS